MAQLTGRRGDADERGDLGEGISFAIPRTIQPHAHTRTETNTVRNVCAPIEVSQIMRVVDDLRVRLAALRSNIERTLAESLSPTATLAESTTQRVRRQ